MNVEARKIAGILGGSKVLGRSVRSLRELDELVREGMPKGALDSLLMTFNEAGEGSELVARLRNKIVPRSTYQRVDRFNLQVSETTERLARLYGLVLEVFEDPHAAARFLVTPHPELDGRVPFDVALTEVGGREVESVIERGLHGLPA